MVSGGFDKLGYIPVSRAVGQCEGQARFRVEAALQQLQAELAGQAAGLGSDLEARCRSYVEFAGNECMDRVNSLVEELQVTGQRIFSETAADCQARTTAAAARETERERARLEAEGSREEEQLRLQYEQQGKQVTPMYHIFYPTVTYRPLV